MALSPPGPPAPPGGPPGPWSSQPPRQPPPWPPPAGQDDRPALDRAVDHLRGPGRPWGLGLALGGVGVLLVGQLLAGAVAFGYVVATGGDVGSDDVDAPLYWSVLAIQLLSAVGLVALAGRLSGGASRAVGLGVRWWDVPLALGLTVAGRVLSLLVVAVLLSLPGLSGGDPPENAQFLEDTAGWAYVAVVGLAVLGAPVLEEVVFRGLLLRAVMARLGFWWGTAISSGLFGVAHVLAATDLTSAVGLFAGTAVLGVVNCLVYRWTDRLWICVLIHSGFNATAVLLLALTGVLGL